MSEGPNRSTRIVIGVTAAVIGILLADLAVGYAQVRAQANVSKPYASFSGAHSHIDERSFQLVTSAQDFAKLWLRHTGKDATREYDYFYNASGIPHVDFDQCMVIAIFEGKSQNIAGIEAVTLTDSSEQTSLQFRNKRYQTGPKAEDVTPYGFFVVRRSPKPLVLEEDVQNLKGEPPVWKEVFRFPQR